jgi:hypothetical protein
VLHRFPATLTADGRGPIDLFIGPIIGVVDHILSTRPDDRIMIAGLSGGGWAATVAGAVDPRISRTLNIAGSRDSLRLEDCGGDFEQCDPQLYARVSLERMYVLSSAGRDREMVQVLNDFDSCCYQGVRGTDYAARVERAVEGTGSGRFSLLRDSTLQDHAVPVTAETVMKGWLRS